MASLLLANLYFPPDTSATAQVFSDLVDSLAAGDHRVTVLCGRPSYRPVERRPWSPLRRERLGDRIVVERVGSAALDMRSTRARAVNYLSFLAAGALAAALRRPPDVAIAGSDPPLALLVGLVAARRRPVVYHLQDLHPEAALAAGWLPDGAIASVWDRVHRWALRRCALVVCLGRDMAARVEAKGVSPERIVVVPNGARPPAGSPNPALVQELRMGDEFTIVHAGNLGVAGAWETLADAARRLDGQASIVCVGGGAREDELRGWGLRIAPFQTDVASVMAAGDVQLVTQRTAMAGLLVPSKLYTALSHGRPILAVVPPDSEVAATVHEWQCGVVANPDDPDDIVAKVLQLRDDPKALAAMSDRSAAAGRQYERGALFRDLAARIEGLVEPR